MCSHFRSKLVRTAIKSCCLLLATECALSTCKLPSEALHRNCVARISDRARYNLECTEVPNKPNTTTIRKVRGPSGRASHSGARGRGFDPHSGRRVVSLRKIHLPPKNDW